MSLSISLAIPQWQESVEHPQRTKVEIGYQYPIPFTDQQGYAVPLIEGHDCIEVDIDNVEQFLKKHPLVTKIALDAINLSGKEKSTIQKALTAIAHNPAITTLICRHHSLKDEDIEILAQSKSITHLDLSGGGSLREKTPQILAANKTLRVVDLRYQSDIASTIEAFLKNNTITMLLFETDSSRNYSGNSISQERVDKLYLHFAGNLQREIASRTEEKKTEK